MHIPSTMIGDDEVWKRGHEPGEVVLAPQELAAGCIDAGDDPRHAERADLPVGHSR